MRPEERVHGCVLEGPKVANVIPDRTKVYYSVRSPLKSGVRQLGDRVVKCFEAAAIVTGCEIDIEEERVYAGSLELCCQSIGSWYRVFRAVQDLVADLGAQTNCLTEIFFDEALERAKFLDEYIAREGKPMDILHGLPISVKVWKQDCNIRPEPVLT